MGTYLGGDFLPNKDDIYLEILPTIVCFANEEMHEVIPRGKDFLGNRAIMEGRPTVEFKVVVKNEINFHDFAMWWNNQVDRGSDWFYAELLFFGIIDVFKCRFVSHLVEEITDGVHWSHVKIEIDTFYNRLLDPSVKYILTCGDITSCAETLECI